ncbi:MAG: MarR family transcriptional regulator [Verrucomicrobiota bacterium]
MFLQRHFLVSLTEQTTELKLSIPQYTLLSFLSVHDSLSMGYLASLMGHSTPAATGLVDRLCKSGLVKRKSGENDRRQVLVLITPKGRTLVEETRLELMKCLGEIYDRLPPNDQESWIRIYQTMQSYCEEKRS